ncbi:hypothetical protein KAR91_47350 [Candidatus Pacearchaeota archaeon]|nr:hypothetical protein [Candidatus Pacearchaeota archaeon]
MDSILTLPVIHNFLHWVRSIRGDPVDVADAWRLLWAAQYEAYGGVTAAGKTSEELEIQTLKLALADLNLTVPLDVSLNDLRFSYYNGWCSTLGLNSTGQLLDSLYSLIGPDVFTPLKFTDGDNRLFHCGFNGYFLDEQSMIIGQSDLDHKLLFNNDGTNSFAGLLSEENDEIEWDLTMPTVADFGTLTIRWLFAMAQDGDVRVGPVNGNPATTDGAFAIQKAADNKIVFAVNGGGAVSIESDDAISSLALTEVMCIIRDVEDTSTMFMYVDGVLQADSSALVSAPDFYTDQGVFVGNVLAPFKGVNYEVSIHADDLTP